jgi:hypothetical protein
MDVLLRRPAPGKLPGLPPPPPLTEEEELERMNEAMARKYMPWLFLR